MPADWNGCLVNDFDFQSKSDSDVYHLLYRQGFAASGTARPEWRRARYDNIAERRNQVEVIERFAAEIEPPRTTIQYGISGGGLLSEAMAELEPDVIDGAVVAAAHDNIGLTAQYLDLLFALRALLPDASRLPIVNIPEDAGEIVSRWLDVLRSAQRSPQGRARTVLAVSLAQFPIWGAPGTRRPELSDPGSVVKAVSETLEYALPFVIRVRYLFEHLAGGNPASNLHDDYGSFFRNAEPAQRAHVDRLYAASGLSLAEDIELVNSSARVPADAAATEFYRVPGRTPSGDVRVPVLRMHETGDSYVPPSVVEGYGDRIRARRREPLYRQVFVDRAGHGSFTPAEVSVAVWTVLERVTSGTWGTTDPADLHRRASELDAGGSAFVSYAPPRSNRSEYLGLPG